MADLLPRPFGNPFAGFIGNQLRYMGNVLGQGRIPYIAPNSSLGPRIGSIPPSANGESYRRAELRLADAARAGGGGGGGGNAGYSAAEFRPIGGTPAERAQAAETSRVAQLTAQDPELQRYEKARQLAVAPGATPQQVESAEDIGMQMWARANPKLAAKVRPGQAGYDTIQGTLAGQAAAQGYGYQMPQQITPTPPVGPNAPQGLPAVQSFNPGETYDRQAMEAKGLQLDPETIKRFQDLLNLAKP
jgi:hypothetical protein